MHLVDAAVSILVSGRSIILPGFNTRLYTTNHILNTINNLIKKPVSFLLKAAFPVSVFEFCGNMLSGFMISIGEQIYSLGVIIKG